MSVQINVAGKVTVKVDTGSSNALETLGVSFDQARTSDRSFLNPVYGDAHGGPAGPPIDTQFLGRIIRIQLELSRYDEAVLSKLVSRTYGDQSPGTVSDAQIGALYLQDAQTYRVVLDSANNPINFPLCTIPSDPIVLNGGTKYSRCVINFEAHRNQSTGVIYNASVS